MKDNFSTTPYMSSNLREYNRIYKEVNDIYRDAASKFGLSNSVFDILYTICEVGEGCLQKDVCDATFIPKQTGKSFQNFKLKKLDKHFTLNNNVSRSFYENSIIRTFYL